MRRQSAGVCGARRLTVNTPTDNEYQAVTEIQKNAAGMCGKQDIDAAKQALKQLLNEV